MRRQISHFLFHMIVYWLVPYIRFQGDWALLPLQAFICTPCLVNLGSFRQSAPIKKIIVPYDEFIDLFHMIPGWLSTPHMSIMHMQPFGHHNINIQQYSKNLVYLVIWRWKTAEPERLSSHKAFPAMPERKFFNSWMIPTLVVYLEPWFQEHNDSRHSGNEIQSIPRAMPERKFFISWMIPAYQGMN